MANFGSLASTIKKSLNVKPKYVHIDNIIFRLHYHFTFWLLIAFVSIIGLEEFSKAKIKCTHSDPTDSRKRLEHVVDTFCFWLSTFTIPRHFNGTDEGMIQPGVGPSNPGEQQIRHGYYQWVPYVLFLQALSFYLPHFIWSTKEGNQLKELVKSFDMVDMEKQAKARSKVRSFMEERICVYGDWFKWLAACEFLNLVNVGLQFYLTDLFLGGRFADLGTKVYQHYGNEEYNPLDLAFPKVSKCTFQNYGTSGTLQTHDLICVLSLNILNEKIFLVLWYWYIMLGTATLLGVIHRIFSITLYTTKIPYNITLFQPALPSNKDVTDNLDTLMNKLSYGEWFFLFELTSNLDQIQAEALVNDMANNYNNPNQPAPESSEKETKPVVLGRFNNNQKSGMVDLELGISTAKDEEKKPLIKNENPGSHESDSISSSSG